MAIEQDRRAAPRIVKIPTTPQCSTSLCHVEPGEVLTRCCRRQVFSRGFQTTPGQERPVSALAPVAGDFELQAESWQRKT